LIVAKKSYDSTKYEVYGNHAMDLDRYDESVSVKRHSKKSTAIRRNNNVKKQLKLIMMVALMLCTGTIIIGRYAMIMSLNNQCISLKNSIDANQKENDNLKLELLKYYNINDVERVAISDLSMVQPSISEVVHLNVPLKSGPGEGDKEDTASKKVGMIGKIIKFFN